MKETGQIERVKLRVSCIVATCPLRVKPHRLDLSLS